MAKKSFKNVTDDNPALAFLGKSAPNDVQAVVDEHSVSDIHNKQPVDNVRRTHDVQDIQTGQTVRDVDDIHGVHSVDDVRTVSYIDNVQNIHNVDGVQVLHGVQSEDYVQPIHDVVDVYLDEKIPVKYTNINLRIPQKAKDFLADESWKARMNITQYINELIKVDMETKRTGQGENHV